MIGETQAVVMYERGTGGVVRSVTGVVLQEDTRVLVVILPHGERLEINWRYVILIDHPSKEQAS